MHVKNLLNFIDFGGFTMDFLGERSIMKVGLLELEAVYESCN